MELDNTPICKRTDLPAYVLCNQSKNGKYAIKNNHAGYWCSTVCFGDYRLYKVEDGERHWVWAESEQQIRDYWLNEYSFDPYEFDNYFKVSHVTYAEASNKSINCQEDGYKILLDIVFNEYKDVKQLEIIASSVY